MPNGIVVGVYIERNGGMVMRAESSGYDLGRKNINPTHANRLDWAPNNESDARLGLQKLADIASQMGGDDLTSISIAGYGPFLSLKRSNIDGKFGQMHPTASNPPLTGTNLLQTFHTAILKNKANPSAFITIHTDAEACAIGEAMARELRDDQLLAFILVTEGIGLGLVQGRRPLSSALHSEIGMLAVRWKSEDILKPEKNSSDYAKSLAEMADNKSLRKRFKYKYNKMNPTDESISASSNREIWDLRAYYLAQACLACTVILPPHQIVVGADIDYKMSIAERIRPFFKDFLDERRIKEQPVFQFDELDHPGGLYIDTMKPVSIPEVPYPLSFRSKGALGMCYAAASADRGAVIPLSGRKR